MHFGSSSLVFGFVNTSIVIREAGEERTTVAVTTIKGSLPGRRLSLRVFLTDETASLGKLTLLVNCVDYYSIFFADWAKCSF